MVRQFYVPDEQRLANTLQQQARSLADVQRPTGTEKARTLESLQQALDGLAAQQERLADAARIYTASTGASFTGPGWMPDPPAVNASSVSKKFRVTVTGGGSGGGTIITFSAPGFPRDRALGGDATAVMSRAVALGGASDAGTAQRSWVVSMPTTGPHTFTAQACPTDKYATAVGLQIDVQPIL